MKRRDFLKVASLAGGAGLATTSGRAFVPDIGVGARTGVRKDELDDLTLADLRAGLEQGRFTALSLTRRYLARIEELDRRGPTLNAVIELNPDALAIARELDRERKARGPRGPLHGMPILLKDNIDTGDRMTTTAGSLALAGSVAARDAFLVERLRRAGAVILGKTNLSEWANFRSTRSTSGWSGRGGLTRNPHVLDRNPSGSSSGSAVAVAAGLCAAAVGTETDGSILSPASYCGIVGLKPTVGLVSRSGLIPISHTQDTAGPMARTVEDAALLLASMAGRDPADPATHAIPANATTDYSALLKPDALRGKRLGVPRKLVGSAPGVEKAFDEALRQLKALGAEIVDPADLPSHGQLGNAEFEVLLYEFKAGLNAYLSGLGPKVAVRSLADLIRFNENHRDREMPFFGQEILHAAEAKGPLTDEAYRTALATCRRLMRTEGIDAVMDSHRLDGLIAPTTGPAHVTDLVHGDRRTGGSTSPAAVAGYPSVTVPMGWVQGLPIGLSFFGRPWSEAALLGFAYAFEQATRVRRPPAFRDSVA
ncbi:MAG: amidase [Verrucomicrobia bacterium]|jgi:amidase|nr:amidase [Verrucomicrobiota bacterium]